MAITTDNSFTTTIAGGGVAPVGTIASADQAAVGTTAVTTTTPWGFGSSTQATSIVTLVNAMRSALITAGVIKGSA